MAVLVVCEDDPSIRPLLRASLRPAGHEIHLASDGAEGLALVERVRPDVLFTDLAMPNLDGFGLIAALKARPALAAIPVVVVTASAQRGEIEAMYARGAVAVVTKPFSPADLRALVARVLAPSATDALSRPPIGDP